MRNLKVVKFNRSYKRYMNGEMAGFQEEVADRLIKEGIASEVSTGKGRKRSMIETDRQIKETDEGYVTK